MFTPKRTRSATLSSHRTTPKIATLKNTPRSSLARRPINPRASLSINNSSFFSSPNVTAAFGSLHHTIEPYETSIPVLVTEAITLAEDMNNISVKISENGWSWLLCDQKMFVWSHYQSSLSKIPTCKELSLKAIESEDNYSAELAAVYCDEDTGSVSAIAVSLLGEVLYWPNILVSIAASSESKIFLSGTQCFNTVSVKRFGFVVCTLDGSLFHLYPTQNIIANKELNKQEGALSSIGRRVSSFFFSSSPQQNVVQMLVSTGRKRGDYSLFILTQKYFQFWKCEFANENEAGSVQLQSETEIKETVGLKLSLKIWDTVKSSLNIEVLDMKIATRRGHIAVLFAISESSEMDAPLHYAVALIAEKYYIDEIKIIPFEYTDTYSALLSEENINYELVVQNPSAKTLQHFLIWSNEQIILKSLASTDGDYVEEIIPFNSSNDRILGAGCCAGSLIIFSALYGLMSSSSNLENVLPSMLSESVMDASLMSPSASVKSLPGTPVVSQTKINQLESSENSAQKLQAAFLHYCKLNLEQAQLIISKEFSSKTSSGVLDSAVAALSEELVDDYPAQDPRWAESVPRDIASEAAGSFILLHQLEDKLKAHTLYLKFLTEVGIWDTLSVIGKGKDKVVTRWLLWEHAEKLYASISLLQNHSSHQTLVDSVIRKVLNHRENISSNAGLTPRDYFYREVSKIHEIFEHLLEEEEANLMKSSLSSRERATLVSGVCTIMEVLLSSVRQYRKSIDLLFCDEAGNHHEFIPWTVGSGRTSIRSIILQQIKVTIERGIPEAEDHQQKLVLHQTLSSLVDLVLDGYQEQLASLSQSEGTVARKAEVNSSYALHRSQIISPLLSIGLRERASALAEKFLDFNTLIQICDEAGDETKIKSYMKRFADQGFSEFLFRWYLDRKEYRKLLSSCLGADSNELKVFLKGHPNLAWMEQLHSDDYLGAHDTLRYLANVEKESLLKKKSYLSLSKLAVAFSGKDDDELEDKIDAITQEQLLIKYQERLPSAVLQSQNEDYDQMKVYSPAKLIQLYIDDVNEHANEGDFKKAFELLTYLPPATMDEDDSLDNEEWKMKIWCQLILRDNWSDMDTMLDPADACSHTLLFKLAILALDSGLLVDILPNVDSLLRRPELTSFSKDSSFLYLIRAGFEWMKRSIFDENEQNRLPD